MKHLIWPAIALGAWLGFTPAHAEEGAWAVGRWELAYDPEGRKADALEFTAEGDVYNHWSDGTRVSGIYIVTAEGVKTVFTRKGKDVIATFHTDPSRSQLRIVTSRSGKETVYEKVE